MTDDYDLKILLAGRQQTVLKDLEKLHVLFSADAADEPHAERVIAAAAEFRFVEIDLNAPMHHVDRALRGPMDRLNEFRVGGEGDLRDAVQLRADLQDQTLGCVSRRPADAVRKEAQGIAETPGGELVDIGVPRGGHRNLELAGDQPAENADVVGTGDVNDVGLEVFESGSDALAVAENVGVDEQVLFDLDLHAAALEFERLSCAVDGEIGLGTGVAVEEGIPPSTSKGVELTSRQRDAINLMEAVGK